MFGHLKALKRIDGLEERLDKVERSFKTLELEWIDTLDRVKRLMGRVAKRAEVDARPDVPTDGAPPSSAEGAVPAPIDPISARILARRHKLINRGAE